MTELPIQSILEAALRVLDSREVPYMIMGGFAVRALGIPRPTYDADLTIDADNGLLVSLFGDFTKAGYQVPEEHRRGFKDTLAGMKKVKVQKFEERHVWDLDLFLVTTAYQKEAFSRRRLVPFLGAQRWMITVEDLILHKLLANRRKDQLDVDELLRLNPSMDMSYMKRWSVELGVQERLDQALREDNQG